MFAGLTIEILGGAGGWTGLLMERVLILALISCSPILAPFRTSTTGLAPSGRSLSLNRIDAFFVSLSASLEMKTLLLLKVKETK